MMNDTKKKSPRKKSSKNDDPYGFNALADAFIDLSKSNMQNNAILKDILDVQVSIAEGIINMNRFINRLEMDYNNQASNESRVPKNENQPDYERRNEGRTTERAIIDSAVGFSMESAKNELDRQ